MRDLLRGMGDMERLVSRAATGLANGRDLVALKAALLRLPELATALAGAPLENAERARPAASPARPMSPHRIAQALIDDPPAGLREGGLIRRRLQPRTGRAAERLRRGQDLDRQSEDLRARAHRHHLAQGRLQRGLRLLHRGHQSQSRQGAGQLHPQADDRERASATSRRT